MSKDSTAQFEVCTGAILKICFAHQIDCDAFGFHDLLSMELFDNA